MSRSGKRRRWYREHTADAFVRQAQRDGYRSRAAYKLLELDERYRLLRTGLRVVELGSAPGGWSQVLGAKLGRGGRVVACDLLDMEPVPGVEFIRGDFLDAAVTSRMLQLLSGNADLVISDMAPNLTGIRDRDRARAEELLLAAADFATGVLAEGGGLLLKGFESPELDALRRGLREQYRKVRVAKPRASRDASSEVYVLAQGYGL